MAGRLETAAGEGKEEGEGLAEGIWRGRKGGKGKGRKTETRGQRLIEKEREREMI